MNIYVHMVVSAAFLVVSSPDLAFGQGAGVGTGRIGGAYSVRGTVESTVQGRTYPLAKGGNVYYQQFVNTRGPASDARLQFLNESRFFVGPNTSVKLDKTIFDPRTQTHHVSLHMIRKKEAAATGRLTTGPQDTTTYNVHTPEGKLTAK